MCAASNVCVRPCALLCVRVRSQCVRQACVCLCVCVSRNIPPPFLTTTTLPLPRGVTNYPVWSTGLARAPTEGHGGHRPRGGKTALPRDTLTPPLLPPPPPPPAQHEKGKGRREGRGRRRRGRGEGECWGGGGSIKKKKNSQTR